MLTITILPSRIKEIIPKQNTDLVNQISINGGLIIRKYYKDALNFKEQMSGCVWRDRLQALFSDMCFWLLAIAKVMLKRIKS